MSPAKRTAGSVELEIEQDERFQEREWRAERIGWTVFALLLLAVLAGLTGGGPLANAVAGKPGSDPWVADERFAHAQAPSKLEIHARAPAAGAAGGTNDSSAPREPGEARGARAPRRDLDHPEVSARARVRRSKSPRIEPVDNTPSERSAGNASHRNRGARHEPLRAVERGSPEGR